MLLGILELGHVLEGLPLEGLFDVGDELDGSELGLELDGADDEGTELLGSELG